MTIQQTLRRLMTHRGISQRELARRLNVTEGWISNILNPRSNPTARTLARIAAALGYTVRFRFDKPFIEQEAIWSVAA